MEASATCWSQVLERWVMLANTLWQGINVKAGFIVISRGLGHAHVMVKVHCSLKGGMKGVNNLLSATWSKSASGSILLAWLWISPVWCGVVDRSDACIVFWRAVGLPWSWTLVTQPAITWLVVLLHTYILRNDMIGSLLHTYILRNAIQTLTDQIDVCVWKLGRP